MDMHALLFKGWSGAGPAPNVRALKRHASSFTRLERGGGRQTKLGRETQSRLSQLAAMHAPDIMPSAFAATALDGRPGEPGESAAALASGSTAPTPRPRAPVLLPLAPIPAYRASFVARAGVLPRIGSPDLFGGSPRTGSPTFGVGAPLSCGGAPAGGGGGGGWRRSSLGKPLEPCFFQLSVAHEAALWQFRLAYRKFRTGGATLVGESPHRVARHRNVWRLRNSDFHKNIEAPEGFSLTANQSFASETPVDALLDLPLLAPALGAPSAASGAMVDRIRGYYSAGELHVHFATELAMALAEVEAPLRTVAEDDLAAAMDLDATAAAPHDAAVACVGRPSAAARGGSADALAAGLSACKPVCEFKRFFKLGRELGKGHFSTVHHARLRERPLSDEQLATVDRLAGETVPSAPLPRPPPGGGGAPLGDHVSARALESRLLDLAYQRRAINGDDELPLDPDAERGRSPAAGGGGVGGSSSSPSSGSTASLQAVAAEPAHPRYPSEVAVKILKKPSSEKQATLLLREVEICAALSAHEGFCKLLDRFESDDSLYLVMELCEGGELFDRICDDYGGAYPEMEARKLMRALFEAIATMHDAGIIHRDLKVENVLFADRSLSTPPKISDFGLSRAVREPLARLMLTGCGTVGYVAPEIIRKEPYNAKVDTFALGVIAFIVLSGTEPFTGDNDMETAQRTKAGDYSFHGDEWERVTPTAKRFIERCLHPDPAVRPSCKELLAHEWLNVPAATEPARK